MVASHSERDDVRQNVMTKAAETRVYTSAVSSKRNKFKLGNPRTFIKRFLSICKTAATTKDTGALNDEVQSFINSDLALFKLHQQAASLEKTSANRNIATLQERQSHLQDNIALVEQDIERKKVELERSKIFKQNQEEYEQLKKRIARFPKKSDTRANIAKIKSEIASLEQEGQRLDHTIELRKKQFCQLGLLLREISGEVDPTQDIDNLAEPQGRVVSSEPMDIE